jgi:tRNA G18 (ribose-2'-O)-methylase SpoU
MDLSQSIMRGRISVMIEHNSKLESLNVATATAIALHEQYR